MKKAFARVAAVAAIALAVVTVRVLVSSRAEWKEAEARLSVGDAAGAVDHFGRAARLYAPGNPWSRRSLDRLEEIARGGDRETTLLAWREVRSSVLATRAIYTPNAGRLAEANERIAALIAQSESPSLGNEAARREWHAERLSRSEEPSAAWSLLALAGLVAWIGCALGFLLRAVDENDRLRRRIALGWAVGFAAGLALFVVALGRA